MHRHLGLKPQSLLRAVFAASALAALVLPLQTSAGVPAMESAFTRQTAADASSDSEAIRIAVAKGDVRGVVSMGGNPAQILLAAAARSPLPAEFGIDLKTAAFVRGASGRVNIAVTRSNGERLDIRLDELDGYEPAFPVDDSYTPKGRYASARKPGMEIEEVGPVTPSRNKVIVHDSPMGFGL